MTLPQFDNTLNQFEIKSPLFRGLGGNGRIFLARSKVSRGEILENAEVAIKVPLVPGNDFQKEMAIAEELRHLRPPGIVDIYETALHTGGYYIIMEYLPGYDLLTEVSTNGPLNVKEALETLIDVCHALAFLHHHGIYHGDVKPENIVRSRNGKQKLVDFGLSRRFAHASSGHDHERQTTAQTDVYQAGETLHYLLTGWLPFFARLESLAQHKDLTSPCSGLPYLWRQPEVAIKLGRIILRCLDLDPEARPSMSEVLQELQSCYNKWMNGNQEQAVRDDLVSFGPWFTSNQLSTTQGVFIDILSRITPLSQVSPGKEAMNQDSLLELGTIFGILGRFREAEAYFRRASNLPGSSAETFHNLGMTLLKQGSLNEAAICFERALSKRPDFPPSLRGLRILESTKAIITSAIDWYREYAAEAQGDPYHAGNAYAALGLWDESIRQYFKALQNQPTSLKARLQLANAYTAKGLIHEAVEELQAALILDPESTSAHTALAANLRRIGRQSESLLHLQTALGMNPFFAPALLELGLTHLDLSHFGNAELAFERLSRLDPDSQQGKFFSAYFARTGKDRLSRLAEATSMKADFLSANNIANNRDGFLGSLVLEETTEEPGHAA